MKKVIQEILKGIDQSEIESNDGWWETSTGAEFGRQKLAEVIEFTDTQLTELQAQYNSLKQEKEAIEKELNTLKIIINHP